MGHPPLAGTLDGRWYYTHPFRGLNRNGGHFLSLPRPDHITTSPTIIPRSEHPISRADISEPALKVLYKLKRAGYAGYLVGGGVRDLLLGRHPKDFDIATDAHPEQVKAVFPNCRLIGRRFRLAHVRYGRDVVEVATFRAHRAEPHMDDRHSEDGRIIRDNAYGTLEEDVWRRDFSVNSLYYNIADFSLVDYVGGMADLRRRRLRMIGDVETRYREDPVRVLRAIRFAAKLGLTLDPETESGLRQFAPLLKDIPAARLFDEIVKLFQSGAGAAAFKMLAEHDVFQYLFPETHSVVTDSTHGDFAIVEQALSNTDSRVAKNEPVTPGFLFAALLWPAVQKQLEYYVGEGLPEAQSWDVATAEVLTRQAKWISIPRRFSSMSREIWILQRRLQHRSPKRARTVAEHPRFRAAQDFLSLRAQAGEPISELAHWWSEFRSADDQQRDQALSVLKPRRRRRRRGSKNVA